MQYLLYLIESTTKKRIEAIAKSQKADKILVEKVVRALMLLEGLAKSDLDFVIKGGTALMLLFSSGKRLSIDIDIIVPDKEAKFDSVLEKICKEYGFIRFEEQPRKAKTKIDKAHYKLFFHSVIEEKESYVLLDILKEEIHYQKLWQWYFFNTNIPLKLLVKSLPKRYWKYLTEKL